MSKAGYLFVGERTGTTSAEALPGLEVEEVVVKAKKANAGNIYVGPSTVTLPNGDDDLTTGFELGAGESTPVLYVRNLNLLYFICDTTGDGLTFIAQR